MAKVLSSVVLDAAATVITDNATAICILTATPAAGSSICTAATVLARSCCSSANFTIGDSSVTGRKIDVAAFSSLPVSTTGVAEFVALYSSVTAVVYAITSCATQNLASTANKVTIPAWIIRFAEAT